jgi:TonB family protein
MVEPMDLKKIVLVVLWCAGLTGGLAQTPDKSDGFGGGVFRVGGGVTGPVVLYKVEPEYTEEACKAKYAGTVVLQLVVDAQARARAIHVVRSLGLGLDEKAIEAVKKWKFRPGYRNGQPVAVQATIEVNFRLGFGDNCQNALQPPPSSVTNEPQTLKETKDTQAAATAAMVQDIITMSEKAKQTANPQINPTLPNLNEIAKPDETRKPTEAENPYRFENLFIQVTRVTPPERAYRFGTLEEALPNVFPPRPPEKGHYFVAVKARAKNIGQKLAICARVTATLKADFGLEYHSAWMVNNRPATISELLPSEETEGNFVFMLKDRVHPLELTLDLWGSEGCSAVGSRNFNGKLHFNLKGSSPSSLAPSETHR